MKLGASLWIAVAAASSLSSTSGFVPAPRHPHVVGNNIRKSCEQHAAHVWRTPPPLAATPNDLASLLTAFDTFDGTSVVDPVVVSGAFWSSMTTKIVSLIIGQLIATVIFSLVLSVAASQLSGILDRVSKGIVERIMGPPAPPLRQPPPEYSVSTTSTSTSSRGLAGMDLQKLGICLAIDVLGTSSELLPIVGELTDVIYAPLAATLLRSLYYGSNVVFLLEFGEEILPFTDVIPLATICWVVDTLAPASDIAKLLQLGNYRQGGRPTSVIDTTTTTTPRILESDKKRDDGSQR